MARSAARNVQRFRGGLVFKAHGLCVSLNSRLESNKEEEDPLPSEVGTAYMGLKTSTLKMAQARSGFRT